MTKVSEEVWESFERGEPAIEPPDHKTLKIINDLRDAYKDKHLLDTRIADLESSLKQRLWAHIPPNRKGDFEAKVGDERLILERWAERIGESRTTVINETIHILEGDEE